MPLFDGVGVRGSLAPLAAKEFAADETGVDVGGRLERAGAVGGEVKVEMGAVDGVEVRAGGAVGGCHVKQLNEPRNSTPKAVPKPSSPKKATLSLKRGKPKASLNHPQLRRPKDNVKARNE